MNGKRKLRAILFADLEGYTALMQSSETRALETLRIFKQTLEHKVVHYHGSIDQYYGDGCLVTFKNAADAMQCAIDLQSYYIEKSVSVRMGLHSGEILYEDGNLYGDSINIASRIESMSISGGILTSKVFRDQVKNKDEFQLRSLGQYDFKNVKEPIEVFALVMKGIALPDPKLVQGKFTPSKSSPNRLWWRAIIVLLAIAAVAIVLNSKKGFVSVKSKPVSKKNPLIAVTAFENKTNSDDLTVIGDLAADWITKGLMETMALTVVSANSVEKRIEVVRAGLDGPNVNPVLDYIIEGNYYLQESSLIVHCRIVDPATQKIVHAFDPEKGQRDNPVQIIEELVQRILGYWEIRDNPTYRRPPKYEAYQDYIEGHFYWWGKDRDKAESLLISAYEKDTTFMTPLFGLLDVYSVQPEMGASILKILSRNRSSLSELERIRLEGAQSAMDGDLQGYLKHRIRLCELDPTNAEHNQDLALAYISVNDPESAIRTLLSFEEEWVDYEKCTACTWRYRWLTSAYYQVGDYHRVLNTIDSLPPFKMDALIAAMELKAAIRLDSIQRLDRKLTLYQNESFEVFDFGLVLALALLELDLLDRDDLVPKYIEQLISWCGDHDSAEVAWYDIALAALVAKNWDDLAMHANRFANHPAPFFQIQSLLLQSLAYFHLNHEDSLNQSLSNLRDLGDSPYTYGQVEYSLAVIEVARGNLEEAVDLVEESIHRGHRFRPWNYRYDPGLKPLLDVTRFRVLTEPVKH